MAIIISDHSESESVTEVASGIGRWSRNGMPPCVFGILAYSTFHFPHFVGFKNFLKQGIYLHVIDLICVWIRSIGEFGLGVIFGSVCT
jgi:hypothetical protein